MLSDPRYIVILNLRKVLQGQSLDKALEAHASAIEPRDRALIAELSYGVCRWYGQLQAIVGDRLQKPLRNKDQDIHLLLILGAYQLMHTRTPAHAVLSTAVDLTRILHKSWASKLVNAVLRGIQRDISRHPERLQSVQQSDLMIQYAQPAWLIEAACHAWPQAYQSILETLQQRAPMTLRLNCQVESIDRYLSRLHEHKISADAHALAPNAVVLQRPMPVEQIPGFREGWVSVQDAGAQLAAHLLDVSSGQRVLDACAAPGGKTGHLLELADSLDLVATDIDEARLYRVADNLQRLQKSASMVVADVSKPLDEWFDQPFDRILLDAPCSATGVMRRHPDIRLLRRDRDIGALAQRQFDLLQSLWPCLKPGGKLLYATCSWLPEENSLCIQHFLHTQQDAHIARMPDALKLDDWGQCCEVGRQILPGEWGMDGFYYALLVKDSVDV